MDFLVFKNLVKELMLTKSPSKQMVPSTQVIEI